MSVDLRRTGPAECNRQAAEVALLPPGDRRTWVFFGGYVGRDPGGDGDLGVTATEEDGRVRGSWQALQAIRNLGRIEIFGSNPRRPRGDGGPEKRRIV